MINDGALNKLREAPLRADTIAEIFVQLGNALEATGAGEGSITLDYRHPDIVIEDDDLLPYITLGLRVAKQ